jgi:hypothetical protein
LRDGAHSRGADLLAAQAQPAQFVTLHGTQLCTVWIGVATPA